MVYLDVDGNPLDRANRYELRFEREPPVGAFRSVTMYDDADFLLVANPIERYSIGDCRPIAGSDLHREHLRKRRVAGRGERHGAPAG